MKLVLIKALPVLIISSYLFILTHEKIHAKPAETIFHTHDFHGKKIDPDLEYLADQIARELSEYFNGEVEIAVSALLVDRPREPFFTKSLFLYDDYEYSKTRHVITLYSRSSPRWILSQPFRQTQNNTHQAILTYDDKYRIEIKHIRMSNSSLSRLSVIVSNHSNF